MVSEPANDMVAPGISVRVTPGGTVTSPLTSWVVPDGMVSLTHSVPRKPVVWALTWGRAPMSELSLA